MTPNEVGAGERPKETGISVDNVFPISSSVDGFFKLWLKFMKPYHNLTEREQDVTAAFLRNRYYLSTKISDPKILNQVLFSEQTKKKIMAETNLSVAHFQVIMGKLRKVGVIENNTLNQKLIPFLKPGAKDFKLLLLFRLEDEGEESV